MYASDHNAYPPAEHATKIPQGLYIRHLTTPLAYITSEANFRDQYPFRRWWALGHTDKPIATFAYDTFDTLPAGVTRENDPVYAATNEIRKSQYGSFLLKSGGPHSDLPADIFMPLPTVNGGIMISIPYDPTNGIASPGHLMRAQK